MAHGPNRSATCGILPGRGTNPCPLNRQADSQPLRHQGSPYVCFLYLQINLSPPCLRIRCKHFRIADKYHPTLALPLVSLSSFHSSTYSLHSRDEETVLRDVKRRGRITQLIGDKFGICSLSSGANTKQNKIKRSPNTKQLSPRPESIRKDPKELSNPRGRSYLSGEVLTAETLEISGSGILLSELSIKVQPQILGALNKNYQQAVLPVCTLLKGRAYVNK
ncbi:uncharacterized protein [Globicephala melas]|uniref:uncharacterized protein isoform X2 n=1 Tax=Globicephala melas TaxID=9731 RepID=UPI00293D2AF4|nr:uncharacterized protein LOC115845916 isoform X2 [Globicephala melas]